MMKTAKLISLSITLALVFQAVGILPCYAAEMPLSPTATSIAVSRSNLWTGNCSITPLSGAVEVHGDTDCFYDAGTVSVELILYREIGTDVWQECWRNTYSANNAHYVSSPFVTVYTGAGRYRLEAVHKADGEEMVSEAGPVMVY